MKIRQKIQQMFLFRGIFSRKLKIQENLPFASSFFMNNCICRNFNEFLTENAECSGKDFELAPQCVLGLGDANCVGRRPRGVVAEAMQC